MLSFWKKQIISISFKFLYGNLKILNKTVFVYQYMEMPGPGLNKKEKWTGGWECQGRAVAISNRVFGKEVQ